MAMNASWPTPEDDERPGEANDQAAANRSLFAWYAPGFSDPLGDRLLLFDNTTRSPLELLRLRPELSHVPGFEACVRRRAETLEPFEDERHAKVCRVDRLPDPGGGLAIVSAGAEGQRLSEILRLAEQRHLQPAGDIVRSLVVELTNAVAAFHAAAPDVVHGALAPERLVVSPEGRLLVTEYVLGAALARVPLERTAFWRDLRLALPPDSAIPAFDQRTDVVQLGVIALALVLGRGVRDEEYPSRLSDLLAEADDRLLLGGWGPIREPFREWLKNTLQLNGGSLRNGIDARRALADVLSAHGGQPFGRGAVQRFIGECTRRPSLAALELERIEPALQLTGIAEPPHRQTPDTDDEGLQGPPVPAPRPMLIAPQRGNRGAGAGPSLPVGSGGTVPGSSPVEGRPPVGPDSSVLANQKAERDDNATPSLEAMRTALRLPSGDLPQLPAAPPRRRWQRVAMIVLLIVALAEGLFIAARNLLGVSGGARATETVTIESNPSQAIVFADGKRAGTTPLRLQLPVGRHTLEVVAGPRKRTLTLTATAGGSVSHYVELPPVVAQTGNLRVVTTPAGGRVIVDGQPRGQAPLLVAELGRGPHEVVVEGRHGSVRQTVDVDANATASVVVPLPGAGAPAPGWVSIEANAELNLYEDGQLLGTSKSERIMVPAGRHEVQLVNDAIGFRATREIQVPVGRTVPLEVILPSARLDINALPWAEVLVDGRRVGETPLASVAVPAGPHIVTFRHPQLGERKVDCVATLQAPTRVSVDLRK